MQEPPEQSDLNEIHAFAARSALAVGATGTIIRTADGGEHWTSVSSGTSEPLFAVSFASASTGWIVGQDGTVLKTTDGGLTWAAQTVPVITHLRAVNFVNEQVGWVAGGPLSGQDVEPAILKTIDGGDTWELQSSDFTVRTMHFVDAEHGFVAGGVEFARTIDGGDTWEAYDLQPPSWFGSVFLVDPLNGWAAGAQGFLTATEDGGVTWETRNSGTNRNISEIIFIGNGRGYYVARNPGTIAATTDAGSTWRFQTDPSVLGPSDICFADETHGWIVGLSGLILRTETGGW